MRVYPHHKRGLPPLWGCLFSKCPDYLDLESGAFCSGFGALSRSCVGAPWALARKIARSLVLKWEFRRSVVNNSSSYTPQLLLRLFTMNSNISCTLNDFGVAHSALHASYALAMLHCALNVMRFVFLKTCAPLWFNKETATTDNGFTCVGSHKGSFRFALVTNITVRICSEAIYSEYKFLKRFRPRHSTSTST
jgi:hypothetical protein